MGYLRINLFIRNKSKQFILSYNQKGAVKAISMVKLEGIECGNTGRKDGVY